MTTKDVLDNALALSPEERALIADALLKTLEPPDPNMDRKWGKVARERLEELRSGRVQAIPGDDVFARIWKRFEN